MGDPSTPLWLPSPLQRTPESSIRTSKAAAYVVGLIFFGLSAFYLVFFSRSIDISSITLHVWREALAASPWGVTALWDYIIGAIFASMYIWMRRGPDLLCMPSGFIAILVPFVGCPLPFVYFGVMLIRAGSLASVFLATSELGGGNVMYEPRVKRARSVGIGVLFSCLLGGFVGVIGWAAVAARDDGLKGWSMIDWVTWVDNFFLTLLVAVVIGVREGGKRKGWLRVLGWWVGLVFGGHGVTCIYVLGLVAESLRRDIEFRFLLLGESREAEVQW